MNRLCLSLWTAVVSWSVFGMLLGPASASAESRQFTFEYETTIGPMELGAGPVDVFVPLAVRNAEQRVLDEEIVASIPGTIEVEDAYGNRFWHGRIENSGTAPIKVSVRTSVERRITAREALAASRGLGQEDRERFEKFLRPNRRVLVDHPMLAPIRKEIRILAGGDDPARVARAIYDWVIANVEYKKVGTGWGNGDTFWACTERYGNCTDFHALFISLARSEGIPARFEIGFPVPEDRPSGKNFSTAGTRAIASTSAPDGTWRWVKGTRRGRSTILFTPTSKSRARSGRARSKIAFGTKRSRIPRRVRPRALLP